MIRNTRDFGSLIVSALILAGAACSPDSPVGPVAEPAPETRNLLLEAISPTDQEGIVGAIAAAVPTVIVKDEKGIPVKGVVVSFQVSRENSFGFAAVSNAFTLTDGQGVASAGAWLLGRWAGTQELVSSISPSNRVLFRARVSPDKPVRILGSEQSAGFTGETYGPLYVWVLDRFGNAVPGIPVTFRVSAGGGSIANRETVSDGSGSASPGTWVLGPTAGLNSVTANALDLDSVVSSVDAFNADRFTWYDLQTIDGAGPRIRGIESGYFALGDSGIVVEQFIAPNSELSDVGRAWGRYNLVGSQLQLFDFSAYLSTGPVSLDGDTLRVSRQDPLTYTCCVIWEYRKRN